MIIIIILKSFYEEKVWGQDVVNDYGLYDEGSL